ncbi:DUF2586 family protein [Spirosoma areae]
MAGLPSVDIEYKNGGLGLVAQAEDRVMGLLINGTDDGFAPFFVTSYDDFITKYSALQSNLTDFFSVEIIRHVRDFYAAAGTGAELWLKICADTDAFITANASSLVEAAEGRINVMGVYSITGVSVNLLTLLGQVNAFAVDCAAKHYPIRIIIDGSNYGGDASVLPDLKTSTYNRVGVCIGSSEASFHASIGLLLGRIADSPVNRNVGRVKSGIASASDAYLTNNNTVKSATASLTVLHNKGYIFLRKLPNRAGYYWNDDHMACPDTDDFYSLANGRVIDKAARIAFATFSEELLDTVFVDDKGKIVKTTLKQYQSKIERAIGLDMGANGEISFVSAFIDPNQDILATSKMVVDLRITPTGTNRIILVKLGLFNPNVA